MEKNDVDDMLCAIMPDCLSKSVKLALLNDPTFKANNVGFDYNYGQLITIASSINSTGNYGQMIMHATQCIDAFKHIWR